MVATGNNFLIYTILLYHFISPMYKNDVPILTLTQGSCGTSYYSFS